MSVSDTIDAQPLRVAEIDSSENHPLVIGAGVMRTGTKSLQLALERLLGGRCYHMTRVFENPQHIEMWRRACREDLQKEEWMELLQGFRAAVDLPTCVFYKQLLKIFPNAKFVLTVRDPKEWYRSVLRTVVMANEEMKSFRADTILRLTPLQYHAIMVDELCELLLGPNVNWSDEDLMIQRYQEHIESVKAFIPSSQLLIFDSKEGWGPLCQFLEVSEPSEPYPHVNTTSAFTDNWKTFLRSQYILAGKQLCLMIANAFCSVFSIFSL